MDMFASIFAANYAFYSNMQGRRPMFYAPVACHPSQVGQFVSSTQSSTNYRGLPSSLPINFSSKSSEEPNDASDHSQRDRCVDGVKFSIDRILNEKADEPESEEGENNDDMSDETSITSDQQTAESAHQFPWLQCTRYRPPKLPSKYRYDTSQIHALCK